MPLNALRDSPQSPHPWPLPPNPALDPPPLPAVESSFKQVTNTPVQGSAADIVAAAMLGLASHERLNALGYRLIMQIHDEVLMEGPAEAMEEASSIMQQVMAKPPGLPPLAVPLVAEPKLW